MGRLAFSAFGFLFLALALIEPLSGTSFGMRLRGISGIDAPVGELDALRRENISLKSEVAALKSIEDEVAPARAFNKAVAAVIYARYPFNFKHELMVSAGREHGVRERDPVFLGGENPIFIGRVRSVFGREAVVRTIYDPEFQESVRIGSRGVGGLLVGGSAPKITLVPKGAPIEEGDPVYGAAPGVPFGAAIGSVKDIRLDAGLLFNEGTLAVPYDIGGIRAVRVLPGTADEP